MTSPRQSAAEITSTRPTKGEETRAMILDVAVRHAAREGYESLTIGVLAEKSGLSKSGVFAHFGSKEDLQIAALNEAVARYDKLAFAPALAEPRGLTRLKAFLHNWLEWTNKDDLSGCPMMAASSEFGSRHGPMRDAVEGHMRRNHRAIVRAVEQVIENGEFRDDVDAEQFAFEIFGVVSTAYRALHLFRDPLARARAKAAFDRLIASAEPGKTNAHSSNAKKPTIKPALNKISRSTTRKSSST
jgi:AcrR family transcriptional regulator